MYLSIVAPFYNEEESGLPFYDALTKGLEHFERTFEMIFVDDGSSDGTHGLLGKTLQSGIRG